MLTLECVTRSRFFGREDTPQINRFCLTDCGPSDLCNPDDCNPDSSCNPDNSCKPK